MPGFYDGVSKAWILGMAHHGVQMQSRTRGYPQKLKPYEFEVIFHVYAVGKVPAGGAICCQKYW